MTNREKALKNMTTAFTLWEKRFRKDPDHFMDAAAQRAKTPGNLAKLRAHYFAMLLDEVRAKAA